MPCSPGPPVLLLDEPTRSLDPMAAARMRELILSLAGGERPVTVLLTSHNLTEVEELCARVAVISRGRIRALDTPTALRATHGQTERVELLIDGLTVERAQSLISERSEAFELKEEGQRIHISFLHEAGDELLDRFVRALQENGGRLIACHSERATLFDVLESYEKEEETEGNAA